MTASTRVAGGYALAAEIRRNTILLALCLTVSWSVIQLGAVLSNVTFARLTGLDSLAGISTAVFLESLALAALPGGRLMDASGRRAGLYAGFGLASAGAVIIWAGTASRLAPIFLFGLAVLGAGIGFVGLARTGAADMYPPARRARGISLVLLGSAAGAILGPIAFTPLLRDVRTDPRALATPWLAAAVVLGLGLVLVRLMRVDPMEIGRLVSATTRDEPARSSTPHDTLRLEGDIEATLGATAQSTVPLPAVVAPARPLRQIVAAAPEIPLAVLVAVVSQSVMTASMSIIGLHLVHQGRDLASVSIALSGHFLGMFSLVLVAGLVVDRVGRENSMAAGLAVLGAGALGLLASPDLVTVVPAMFAIGLGWNLSFVASTATLADASEPSERGRLLAAMDFASVGTAAVGSVLAAAILGQLGLEAVVGISLLALLVPVPALWNAHSVRRLSRVGASPP